MSDNDTLLDVRNVSKVFGGEQDADTVLEMIREKIPKSEILEQTGAVLAVRDVSFSVQRGEFFVIMGLSGSGKSTLIRCLIRLIDPTSGEILIDGQDIVGLPDAALREVRRKKTAMVFQHYGLLPHKTVLENTEYGLKVRGVPKQERRKKAEESIARVGLSGWEEHRPSALSGGMQQRVGLARALAHDPEILLMDEPFSGLDPLIRRQMQEEFAALQDEVGITTILVTHDLDEALTLGDRIAIMRDGEIIQVATPEELIVNPVDDYVARFVEGASPTKFMTAQSIMDTDVPIINEGASLQDALRTIRRHRARAGFVVNRAGQLRGMVSTEALAKLGKNAPSDGWEASVEEAVTTTPDVPIEEIFSLIIETPYSVAVVGDDRKLMGRISRNRLLETLAQGVGQNGNGTTGDASIANKSGVGS